ncbi:M16 family metallopeptidase [Thermodesulfobacteriota bacterium]
MLISRFIPVSSKIRINISAFISLLLLVIATGLQAQTPPQNELPQEAFTIALEKQPPLDPKVVIGELDNGIRYYIRRNTEPANRAELRLVINSGSVLEDEKQLGLAHVLEHMAFQGTENFEKKEILDYMESIGMQIGSGINAGTGFDETIYMLKVPMDDISYVSTAFRILKDWTTALTLDPEEIELERKVVIEEWRQGLGARERIRDKTIPVILKDSLYAQRLPIGTLENLQNFSHDDLNRFYKDWYRPDLMAVIAVGDFDTAEIEKLIKEQFKTIHASEEPRKREGIKVPDHDETLFVVATDPELPMTQVSVYHKFPEDHDWTVGGIRQKIVEGLYSAMLNARFQEISRKPDPPFLAASSGRSSLVRPLAAYMLMAMMQETGIERGLETLFVESERVARFGFTAAELERQKTSLLRGIDQIYANRDSRNSGLLADEMGRAFLTGEAIPGIEFETALYRRFISGITLEEVNQVGKNWIKDANRVVVVTAPEKAGFNPPSVPALKNVLASAANMDIAPYKEIVVDDPLLADIPAGSRITEKHALEGGLIEWKLANGVTVILKPTDFKEDEIVFTGFSPGGTSLASDEDFIPADTATTIITNGGLGKFNAIDLQKKLTGKVANVSIIFSDYEEGVTGSGSPVDLETLFQLIYLRMTAPRADEVFFNIFKTQMKQMLANRTANPLTVFSDKFNELLYSNHLRRQPPIPETMDKTDLNKSLAFYKERFADTGDFIFCFAGSIDLDVMKPLVETYLGALPNTGRKETWTDVGIRSTPRGIIKETVRRGKDPKSTTRIAFTGTFNDVHDPFERTLFRMTTQLLQTRLFDVIRELLGGTYGVQVGSSFGWEPVNYYLIGINFSSDPERVDELTHAIFSEIKLFQESGPKEQELNDIKQAFLRSHETGLEQNAYWLANLKVAYSEGVNPGAKLILSYPDTVNAATVQSARKAFQQYYDMENYLLVTLLPEE